MTISSSSSSSSTGEQLEAEEEEPRVEFNFFNEFYTPHDSNRFQTNYNDLCDSFMRGYFSSSTPLLRFILTPRIDSNIDSANSFKFTLDYLKPFSVKLKLKQIENYLDDLAEESRLEDTDTLDYEMSDYYANLKLTATHKRNDEEFQAARHELKNLIFKKVNYLLKWLTRTQERVEANNEVGARLLECLERTSITSLELDKYKLLVNESDVITNLTLKLSNKLANTENSIQIINLKHAQSSEANESLVQQTLSLDTAKETNEEIDLLKQEVNQIQRKKEEAVFLKNGIDKRALVVSDYLKNYLRKEQYQEYELFIQMKSVHSIQIRHIKDHIELAQLQLKLLNDLV